MSFDWFEYLTLAERLASEAEEAPSSEACYRTAVSRAYYSVYCLTRNYVRDTEGVDFYDHSALHKHLIDKPHKLKSRLGKQLKNLLEHRIKADYYDDLGEAAVNKASRALKQAKKIKEGLDRLT
jgi:uncharacterized protein (UPF0332 family)